jgi:subtilisin-like proprotein convertase family protein
MILYMCGLVLVVLSARERAAATTYSSNDVPKEIAKTGTTTSTLTIAETGAVDKLRVELDISFIWDADLDVYLVAPDGTRVELFTGVGGMGTDFSRTVLDDEADTSIADGEAPFAGRYRPEGSLADLVGAERQGTWALEITNQGGWFSGTLNSWALAIGIEEEPPCPPAPEPVQPDPPDGAVGVPVDTALTWRITTAGPAPFRLLTTTGQDRSPVFSLFELNRDPVEAVRVGDSCRAFAIDFSPSGELYGCDDYRLYKLAVSDAGVSCTTIGEFRSTSDESILMTGLAFHPDGTLYGSTFELTTYSNVIYTIDEETALVTEVCRFDIDQGIAWSIDFSPEGDLYAAFLTLMLVDLDACEAVALGDALATDMDYAPDGFIYMVDEETEMLYQVDPSLAVLVEQYGPYEIDPWGIASQILDDVELTGPANSGAQTRLLKSALRALLGGAAGAGSNGAVAPAAAGALSVAAASGSNPVTYDVYVDTMDPPTAVACDDVESRRCEPVALNACTTYYWQVAAENACGETATGPVWSFTTESVPADFDTDCDVDFDDLAVFASYWLLGSD